MVIQKGGRKLEVEKRGIGREREGNGLNEGVGILKVANFLNYPNRVRLGMLINDAMRPRRRSVAGVIVCHWFRYVCPSFEK